MRSVFDFLEAEHIFYQVNESLAKHSTFRIGGICRLAIFPKNRAELVRSIKMLHQSKINFCIVGKGSNLLFPDEKYHGAVLFTGGFSNVTAEGTELIAEAGASLAKVAAVAARNGLSSMEFAAGIPGTVGGAIITNAGAFGSEMSDVVLSSEYYNPQTGEFGTLLCKNHHFSYRHSIYAENPNLVVMGVKFRLNACKIEDIYAKMSDYSTRRKNTQPLEFPSAGSIFCRPAEIEFSAGELIEKCGLKGFQIGGAQVSQKHAGFIVNTNHATATDVKELIKLIQYKVYQQFGVLLQCEIRFLEQNADGKE